MKVTVLVLFFFVAVAVTSDAVEEYDTVEVEWPKFKKNFNKHYNGAEEETNRLVVFKETLKSIKEHNKKYKSGEVSHYLVINQFADLAPSEVSQKVDCPIFKIKNTISSILTYMD